eukprot:scaffold12251_cov67-Skeletonema_dohrnii-CCMP3373.AAC.1
MAANESFLIVVGCEEGSWWIMRRTAVHHVWRAECNYVSSSVHPMVNRDFEDWNGRLVRKIERMLRIEGKDFENQVVVMNKKRRAMLAAPSRDGWMT